MTGRLRRLLIEPAAFFDAESPSLSRSGGVLLAVGVVSLGIVPPVVSLLRSPVIPDDVVLDAFPSLRYVTTGWEVSVPGVVGLLVGALLAMPVLFCLLFAALFYLLSWPVASERGFGRTAGLVAWGFVPQLVANVPAIAALLVAFPSTPTEVWALGMTVPARVYASPPAFDPLFATVTAVGVICTLWSGYLWAHAVAAARGLSLRQAIAVVTVPTILVLGPI
ncbi:YIP1 family protein [Natrinema thermotolerans]|uniref:YIP1 family protein n=1 Tax=Natrinema thermotolerans TaxID=121872 RepID=A0AAF0PER1_9EURY|nr:YIP1 family protein [Natrinema thermotolerans]QCC58681.1 hypothetical protein DVR14_08600 [Natrinema thermotolerans]WMT09831.1 YIP1 family protein [Natrinema thermotolerans]